ncbi:hypothetical protein ILYODFUR_013848 [Ilyodon furcidens]|uniref:Uncharacterized protein n=1 Tax=Ilyodon furcidens TaxID=33524 RepID=A0ABV0SLN7_9TELE
MWLSHFKATAFLPQSSPSCPQVSIYRLLFETAVTEQIGTFFRFMVLELSLSGFRVIVPLIESTHSSTKLDTSYLSRESALQGYYSAMSAQVTTLNSHKLNVDYC